jgi:hypothetical protein
MRRLPATLLLAAALTTLSAAGGRLPRQTWETPFERSGGTRTPSYQETVEFCRRLARVSPDAHFTSFGVSPQNRRLPLLILSRDHAFDPARARTIGKPVVLIQSGIHAGEIDGKDASLMLARDMLIYHRYAELLDKTIILFVPIFNVDGHERFGPYNRINQNGPEEMGWRTTAQNLNLNRDYMKADAPEMRAMLRLFSSWLPDLLVDCHVTDGIDFQYDVTYAVEYGPNIDARVSSWLQTRLLPTALSAVEHSGHKVFYYVFPREEHDLSKGLLAGAATPRFSTGYAALQNRPAVLIETHMLKPYRTRVEATYAFLRGILAGVAASARELRHAVRAADSSTVEAGRAVPPPVLPVKFGLGKRAEMKEFLGIEAVVESSAVSGGWKTRYTGVPVTMHIPFYGDVTVEDSVTLPRAYTVPAEWTAVRAVLQAHGIRGKILKRPVRVRVEGYRFAAVRFLPRSYEGRQTVTFTATRFQETKILPAGTAVFPTAQRAGRVLANLLEPGAPDALVGWGFFNSIFEQKEYAEPYVVEAMADSLFRNNPELREAYWTAVRADSALAKDPAGRLQWIYRHSPWGDPLLNVYPVRRIVDADDAAAALGERD